MGTEWIKKDAAKKTPPEYIEVPVYFMEEDDGKIIIDEEGIRDEFDKLLRLLMKKY